jgi:hypothetical protein
MEKVAKIEKVANRDRGRLDGLGEVIVGYSNRLEVRGKRSDPFCLLIEDTLADAMQRKSL